MPSFDVVCEPDMVELKNAIEQSNKEISNRFDFKGSDSRVEQKDEALILFADDEFKLGQVRDVLIGKMAKRNVDVRYLKDDKTETIGGDKRKQTMKIQKGITSDLSKKVVRIIKDSKLKVQASIQGDAVRVTGAKRDDLQAVMAMLRKQFPDEERGVRNLVMVSCGFEPIGIPSPAKLQPVWSGAPVRDLPEKSLFRQLELHNVINKKQDPAQGR